MDASSVVTIISTVGFPIAMCIIMAWYIKYMTDKHTDESEKFTNALNANTVVLQKLCDALNIDREDKE